MSGRKRGSTMLRIAPNAPKGQVFFRENPSAKLRAAKQFPRLGTTGSGEREFGPFVASKFRPHFHRPECKWITYVNEHNLLEFSSHEEAVAAGLKPCKTCRA